MLNITTLIRQLNKVGITLPEASFIIGIVIDCLTESLSKGEEIKLRGFGSFYIKKQEKKLFAVNGEILPGYNRIIFKASRKIKKAVNSKKIK